MRQLLDLAAADAMASFDRTRPPWRAALVEGLEDGRAAYVLKLHHSLTDGQGATQLLGLLHSHTREPSPDKPFPAPPAPEPASPLAVLAEQAAGGLRSAPAGAVRRVAGGTGQREPAREAARRRPADGARVRALARSASSPRRRRPRRRCSRSAAAPGASTRSTCRSCSSRQRATASADRSTTPTSPGCLAAFAATTSTSTSPIGELAMAMPISLRRGDHPMGGNRFAGARFAAPVGEPDPASASTSSTTSS